METLSIFDIEDKGVENGEDNAVKVDEIGHRVDELFVKVDKLEGRVDDVERYYSTSTKKQPNASRSSSILKDKDKMKHIPGFKKHQQDASRREAAAAKRMQELMRQFGPILRQITQHKWAWPFMQPVDVEGLGLRDYFEVIDRPMDFSTIKNQMEAKDGTGYKHVRDICADVRLIFKNAMKYNDDKSDVHMMAKTLLEKFEEKWLQRLPKIIEEEKRHEEEEAEALLNLRRAQEAAHSKIARELCNELYEADMHLEELRELVVQKCRKMSIQDKRNLGIALTGLSPESLSKALEIVARKDPSIHATSTEINLDINAQSEATLWRLRIFVKEDALEAQGKSLGREVGNTANIENATSRPITNTKSNANMTTTNHPKRKIDSSNALPKTAKKSMKHPS